MPDRIQETAIATLKSSKASKTTELMVETLFIELKNLN
jgi:hypothetical protein